MALTRSVVRRRALLVGALLGAAMPFSLAETARADTVKIRLGTATPGGGFPVYGAAFVDAVRGVDPGLEIEQLNTKGSTENVPMLEDGRLDIALVQGEVVHEALMGIGRPPADLRVVTAMYATAGMFVVRADLGDRSIGDLKGKPIAWGAQGSGLVILGRYAMDGLGLDAARDFQPIYLERAGDGPAMVLDGRVAALWGGGAGWPGFMTVARSEKGARFIAPNADEIARILARHAFLKRVTQAAGSFPGQADDIASVGSWSFVMARPGLDEAIVFRLAKALHDVEKAGHSQKQLAETTLANTVAVAPPGSLHAGVARYLREAGLTR
jgi:TRAP transporter TAXI family solute receptor